jgi:hypothetical protein
MGSIDASKQRIKGVKGESEKKIKDRKWELVFGGQSNEVE